MRYFLSVEEHRNFTEAAKHLYISQSALSHHIAEFEKELGVKLFFRTTRLVTPTPAGIILRNNARDLIDRLDAILENLYEAETGVSGELKIGYLTTPFKKILPEPLLDFKERRPDVKIQYLHYDAGALQDLLLRGEIDIAFTVSCGLVGMDVIEYRDLLPDGIGLAVPMGHPIGEQTEIDYTLLAKEPFVLLEKHRAPAIYDLIIKVCAARGFVPNIVKYSASPEAVLMDVEAGFGLAMLPASIAKCVLSNLSFIEVKGEDTKFSNIMSWRKDNPNPCIPPFIGEFDQ